MAFIVDILRLFKITVQRANGTPVVGASIRILNASFQDVTASFFTTIQPVTNASGICVRPFVFQVTGLPVGQTYTIQVIAAGFNLWQTGTSTGFDGTGEFIATLERSSAAVAPYTITLPPSGFLSALYPIDTSVESGATDLDWELIRFNITHSDSRTSVLEAPVVDSIAEADLHSRVRLHPRPNLVPDGTIALADPDFSDQLTVSIESLNMEGTQSIEGGFLFSAANMEPDINTNDLLHYTMGGSDGRIKWITLLKNPVVFRGYYTDVMIWLVDLEADYRLATSYYDGAGNLLGSSEDQLTGNSRVQRIRLNATPDALARRAELVVTSGETVITQTLTVFYRG